MITKVKLLPYQYRCTSGQLIPSKKAYTGSKADAISRLKKDFNGSITPLVSIDGKLLKPLRPLWRQVYINVAHCPKCNTRLEEETNPDAATLWTFKCPNCNWKH